MEISDTIAVMNSGKIEQVGSPREVYDAPATQFVMGFIGPVSRVDGHLVRPHDVSVSHEPEPGAVEAMVTHVAHLGFEVRIELELSGGDIVYVKWDSAHAPSPPAVHAPPDGDAHARPRTTA